MKLMIKSALVIFFGMFLMLASCAKKNSSAQNRGGTAPRGDQAIVGGATTLGVTKCSDGVTNATGRVFDDSMYGNTFRNNWANFFSATMADNLLGDLSGSSSSTQTGVNITLKLKISGNQLNLAETKLSMDVKDSLVGTQATDSNEILKSILVDFSKAESGNLTNVNNGTGNFTVVFADGYGKVTITGSFNQTKADGTVTFANSVHYDNESPKSGSLGRFSLNSCGLFY